LISQRTISRNLRKANLVLRVAHIKPFISDNTKKEYKDWAEKPGEEFNDDCLVLAIKSKGIMMWECFSWWGLDQFPNNNGIFQHDDLNPIENLWSERMVKEECEALAPSYYRHLVESKVDCVQVVYDND
ncbi:11942_t:CDS:2, partial [Dentiscutata erythropus]